MEPKERRILSFTEARKLQHSSSLRQSEIPIEHAISLPMPTNRWGEPGYALFASPALRRPGQPVEQGGPDRWWVVSANGGNLIVYARSIAVRFSGTESWPSVTMPPVNRSIDEMRQALREIDEVMDALAPAFFAGEKGDAQLRGELASLLGSHLPEPLVPQYRELAPDFFAWLES